MHTHPPNTPSCWPANSQAVSATVGPATNWRLPFVLVSIPALLVALLMLFTVDEPPRGGFEEALREVYVAKAPGQQQPSSPTALAYKETITWAKVKVLLTIRSNWLCIAQVGCRHPNFKSCLQNFRVKTSVVFLLLSFCFKPSGCCGVGIFSVGWV